MEKNVIIHPVAAYTFSYLKNKEISEYRAAKDCGFSHVVFSHWKKGKKPSGDILDKLQAVYTDFNRSGNSARKDFADIPYDPTEQESEIIRLRQMISLLQHENGRLKDSLYQKDSTILNLSTALGKDEGETEAYLADTEIGYQMMNLITIVQHGGFALNERKN
jgi:hypothetical protein